MLRIRTCRFVMLSTRVSLGLVMLASCGGGDGMPNPNGLVIAKANPSGDNQAGRSSGTLADPLRVLIAEGGTPRSGTTVTWQVTQGGGSVNPTSAPTNASGIASTVVTLGGTVGEMRIQASASGTSGGPLTFTAITAGASATVQVNNNQFQPQVTGVTAGGTVSFVWGNGSTQHNLVPDGGNLPSDPTIRDGPFTRDVVFPSAGTFRYHCSVHGAAGAGMNGTVIVVP